MNLKTLPRRIERTITGHYRVMIGAAIAAHVIAVADGSGWRVNPAFSARRRSRKSWPSPRAAFRAYFAADPQMLAVADQLPEACA